MLKRRRVAGVFARLALAGPLLAGLPLMSHAQSDCDTDEGGECTVSVQGSLAAARQAYRNACPTQRVRDCDPIAGGWQCSSGVIGNNAPGGVQASSGGECGDGPTSPAPDNGGGTGGGSDGGSGGGGNAGGGDGSGGGDDGGACEITTQSSLGSAREQFRQQCPGQALRDCDPFNGGWRCSSEVIGASAPGGVGNGGGSGSPTPPDNPTPPTNPPSVTPQLSWADSYSANGQCYCQSTFDHGIGSVQIDTPVGRRSVRQVCAAIGAGPGSNGRPLYNDVQCGNGPPNNRGDEDPGVCPGRVDQGASGCSVIGPRWNLAAAFGTQNPPTGGGSLLPGSRYRPGDLLSLHYDHCPDRDDGHATVAGKELVDRFPVRTLVVSGTCGYNITRQYDRASEPVMNATWGNGGWLNAIDNRSGTIRQLGTAWSATLANGDDVWVAEGGPSDITADAVRWIASNNPQLDRRRIRVIQHSEGFNQDNTSGGNLNYLRQQTDYRLIPNGNRGGNGSANLNTESSAFVAAARQSSNANAWDAAFRYLNPNRRLDFSDTVEFLYILNDTSVQNVNDFANRYMR